jgi:hypothetical protein
MRIFTSNVEVEGVTSHDIYEIRYNPVRSRTAVRSTFEEDAYEAPGEISRSLVISYFTGNDDGASVSMSETAQVMLDAVESGDPIEISATVTRGAVSVANPRYTWTVYVLEAGWGGTNKEPSTFTTSLSVIGPPVVETS